MFDLFKQYLDSDLVSIVISFSCFSFSILFIFDFLLNLDFYADPKADKSNIIKLDQSKKR